MFGQALILSAMLLAGGNGLAEEAAQSPEINEEYELDSWTSAKEINTIEAYEVYLAEYAKGRHAKFAQAAINKIKKAENLGMVEEDKQGHGKAAAESPNASPLVAPPPQAASSVAAASAAVAAMPAPTPTPLPASAPASAAVQPPSSPYPFTPSIPGAAIPDAGASQPKP